MFAVVDQCKWCSTPVVPFAAAWVLGIYGPAEVPMEAWFICPRCDVVHPSQYPVAPVDAWAGVPPILIKLMKLREGGES